MEDMLALAEQEGIVVEYYPLQKPLMGVYMHQCGSNPVIGISSYLRTTTEQRCVMAEELGHHFTSVGACVPDREFYHHSERSVISKVEYKAIRWAANYLIPENDLLDAIKSGLYEPWEIAEHFNVTDDFAIFRMRLFGARGIP